MPSWSASLGFALLCGCTLLTPLDDLASGGHAVGGTVDGLAGAHVGVVLNGGPPLDVTDGSFTFPARLADGAAYVVTVSNPPAAHVCAVQRGSGVVAGADVSVAVHCPSTVTTLSDLSLSAGALSPAFDPAELTYDVGPIDSRLLGSPTTTVTATTSAANATLTIDGAPAISGVASAPIALGPGANPIPVVVTTPDGATQAKYVVTATTSPQVDYVKASNTRSGDNFGTAVAIDGDTLVVGAANESSGASGVGANQNDTSAPMAGAVYVYVRVGSTWTQQAYIKASNARASALFGRAVALSGDTLVVGAPGESSNATGINGNQADTSAPNKGAAYVFTRTGAVWKQTAYLKPSNAGGYFGVTVALSGNTLVVGAPSEASNARGVNGDQTNSLTPYAGAAYVFVSSNGSWQQQAYLKASNTLAAAGPGEGLFGCDVSLVGDTLAVGAYGEGSAGKGIGANQDNDKSFNQAGAVYVFQRSGTAWAQQVYIKPSNTQPDEWFGWSVALDGSAGTLFVGAETESSHATGVNGDQGDESMPAAGAVYVFVSSGGAWKQQAYLKASNTRANQQFGHSLAVIGDTLVIGANEEASSGVGVGGIQNDTAAFGSGAAYWFERAGTQWAQSAYIKAPNASANAGFGWDMAVSGTTLVIAARLEASAAIGVNGDESDTSANGAGAAYVY